jgi:hypothetical protein
MQDTRQEPISSLATFAPRRKNPRSEIRRLDFTTNVADHD